MRMGGNHQESAATEKPAEQDHGQATDPTKRINAANERARKAQERLIRLQSLYEQDVEKEKELREEAEEAIRSLAGESEADPVAGLANAEDYTAALLNELRDRVRKERDADREAVKAFEDEVAKLEKEVADAEAAINELRTGSGQ